MKAIMKLVLCLGVLGVSELAHADLTCQGYNTNGETVPVQVSIKFVYNRTLTAAIGYTTITFSDQSNSFQASYQFGNPQTRCASGPSIGAKTDDIEISLYSFNPCDLASQIPAITGDYKGSMIFSNSSEYGDSVLLGCQSK